MHTHEEISQTIRKFIMDNIFGGKDNPDLKNETSLIASRMMDSIVALKLVTHLETTYNIEFEAHEVTQENLDSINKIASFVQGKLK